jgi:fatty acid desaturase
MFYPIRSCYFLCLHFNFLSDEAHCFLSHFHSSHRTPPLELNNFLTMRFTLLLLVPSAIAFQVGHFPKAKLLASTMRPAVTVPLNGPSFVQEAEALTDATEIWVHNLDYDAFAKDVNALGKELLKDQGAADVEHLNKILSWRNIAALVGIATMWTVPNPITIAALSTWTYASWTMVAHHVSHGGYNRVDAGKYNSRGFAIGSIQRRISDWTDWMFPEAWNVEHNRLHHYHLGELEDPDLVQRNLEFLRVMDVPTYFKYLTVAFVAPIWKWFYYSPNTYKELKIAEWRRIGKDLPKEMQPLEAVTLRTLFFPQNEAQKAANQVVDGNEFLTRVLAPMLVSRFVLLPAPLLLVPGVGPTLFGHALVNLVLADMLTNIHGFLTIVTNHAGDDVFAFDSAVKPKTGSFYVRQIVGSVNYEAGNDLLDFSHGWLNYQIEHHVWPDLSMLQYQKAAPRLKQICETHGVPYIQESVFERLRKTVDVMVGKSTMPNFPTQLEPAKDRADASGVTWKSTHGAIDDE